MVAAGIVFSRAFGLIRETVLAAFLGTGPAADAFTIAMRIPNLLQNLFGEGVLSASFIPVYSKLLAEEEEEQAGRTAGTVLSLLLIVTGLLVLLGVFAAGPVTRVLAPGLSGESQQLTAKLVSIVTPGVGLLVTSAWCLGILNSHRVFFLSYVAPVLWNTAQIIALVVGGVFVYRSVGESVTLTDDAKGLVTMLAWATVVGAILQLAIQLPKVISLNQWLQPRFEITTHVRSVLQRFLPVVGARGVVQLSAWIDQIIATFLVTGGVAALRYGQTLYLLPISLFGMSIAASELPEVSRTGTIETDDDRRVVRRRVGAGLRRITYLIVPVIAAYIVAGDLLVGTLFQRGSFTRANTVQLWFIVGAYAVGLFAATTSRLLQSALYGLGDTRTPAIASIARVAGSIVLGYLLMIQFDRFGITSEGIARFGTTPAITPLPADVREVSGTPHFGAVGLALGTGIASWIELWWLHRSLSHRIGPFIPSAGVLPPALAGASAAAFVITLVRFTAPMFGVFLTGTVGLIAAGITYLVVTRLLGYPIAAALKGRPFR